MKLTAIAIGVLMLVIPGCARDSDWFIRQPGVESTIARDPNSEPVGRSIPPAGMGVDL
jgi:hypothetical protein